MAACDSFLGEGEKIFTASSMSDCHAAGWCIAASECRLRLSFRSMGSGAEVCEAFSSGVKSRKEVRGSVSALDCRQTHIGEEGVVHLMELPSSIWHNMSSLDVSSCELNACAIETVAKFVRIHFHSLKELDISRNKVGEGGLVKLFNTLSQHGCLERLSIGRNSMGCTDVKALARVIRRDSGQLKELSIDENLTSYLAKTKKKSKPQSTYGVQTISPEYQTLLVETVLQPSSLDTLKIYNVNVSSASYSFALLADNPNLTSITVGNIGPALPSLLKGLEGNKSVKTLNTEWLQSSDVAALVKMLSINKYLEALDVALNLRISEGLDEEPEHSRKMCLDIISTLQTNNTLNRFELCSWGVAVSTLFTQTEKDKMDSRLILP